MTADTPVVRLTSPGEIAAAVPHLCGFVPTESIVAISLRGERRRIGLTLRLDLPAEELHAEAAEQIAARLAHDGAAAVALVVFTAETGERPRADLVEALLGEVEQRGITVMEGLLVRDGLWSSYTCRHRDCCPAEGTPISDGGAIGQLAAAAAYDGRAVLRDRDELVASIAGPVLLAARAAEQRLDEAVVAWLEDVAARGRDAARSDALTALRQALAAPPADAAALIASLQDIPVRDEVMIWAIDEDEALLSLLLSLARQSTPPYDAPVCTLLAVVAWVRGDGALANVALDRALDSDPTYNMAQLLRIGLDGQLPPTQVRTWLQASRRRMHPRQRPRARRRRAA